MRSARNRAWIAGGMIALLVLAALVGPMLHDADPNALDLSRATEAPSSGHPLGTDESGRDVLGRLLAGGRVSLAVGLSAVACSALLGLSLGALAGLGGLVGPQSRAGLVDQVFGVTGAIARDGGHLGGGQGLAAAGARQGR